MGYVIYEFEDRLYRVVGRDSMNVVLENIRTDERISVTGQMFMSSQFRAVKIIGATCA